MLHKHNKRPKHRKLGFRLIAAGSVLIAVLVMTDMHVRPMLRKAGEFQSRVIAVRIINNAVREELDNHSYCDLMSLTYDEAGNVLSVETNMVQINRLKARITELINEDIAIIGQSTVEIPLGTVSGINMLYGRGPAIPVRLTPRGAADVNLVSKFTPAGINQTLHQITLSVAVDISAIIPGYTTFSTVETEFIVAQTVIVGRVPDSYANIVIG
jgi:sporulation protein YunB